jgi:hypothetical protein
VNPVQWVYKWARWAWYGYVGLLAHEPNSCPHNSHVQYFNVSSWTKSEREILSLSIGAYRLHDLMRRFGDFYLSFHLGYLGHE